MCHLSCGCDGEDKSRDSGTAEVKEASLEKTKPALFRLAASRYGGSF